MKVDGHLVNFEDFLEWMETRDYALPEEVNTFPFLELAKHLVLTHLLGRQVPSDIEKAVAEATYAQAAYWITNGLDPRTEGLKSGKVAASASLLGGSVTYADASQALENRSRACSELFWQSRQILALAGVRMAHPEVVG